MTILVTGSTGKTGRRVVEDLRGKGIDVRAASRTPGSPADGLTWVHFDWSDPGTYEAALDGVEAVYQMLDPNAVDTSDEAAAFLELASQSGVRRLVHLSNTTAHLLGDHFPMERAERLVTNSPLSTTILRANVFFENFPENPLIARGLRQGIVSVPAGDAHVAAVSVKDIAHVAAVALTEDGHDGVYSVTGPEPLSFAEQTAIVSAASGRPLKYVAADPAEFTAQSLAAGIAPHVVEFYSAMYDGIRAGWAADVSEHVYRVTGRQPLTFSTYAAGVQW